MSHAAEIQLKTFDGYRRGGWNARSNNARSDGLENVPEEPERDFVRRSTRRRSGNILAGI